MIDEPQANDAQDELVPPNIVRDQLLVVAAVTLVLLAPVFLGDFWQMAGRRPLGVVVLLASALLPLAVTFGSQGRLRGSVGLLIAAAAWAWLVPLLWLLPTELTPSDGTGPSQNLALRALQLISLLVRDVAPLLVVVALADRRVTQTTWPRPLVVLVVAIAGGLGLVATKGSLDQANLLNGFMGTAVDPLLSWINALHSGIYPLWPLSLAGLSWFAWSGVRAGERPLAFWRLLRFASGGLLLAWLAPFAYSVFVVASLISTGAPDADPAAFYQGGDLLVVGAECLVIAAYGGLILAFARFLPRKQVDEIEAPASTPSTPSTPSAP